MRQQQSIAQPVHVEGFGFWSGQDVRVEFRPALPDSGIVFVRGDRQPPARIPALVANRVEIPRRTTLSAAEATVEMVEHVLAACAGLQIDNCEIWCNRAEMPGCDGSSLWFVEALLQAGVVQQHAPRAQLVVTDVTRVGNDESWIEARPAGSHRLSLNYRLNYETCPAIGRQTIELTITRESFQRELAPSRTFLTHEEAEWLQSQGLGERVTGRDVLVFDNEGPMDNELRFPNECVRHKALDVIGDLSLAGCDVVGHIVAHRSGHRLNAELVRALLLEGEIVEARRKTG